MTIYAKDLPPNVRSSLATGLYTPDSRICLEQYATPAFKQQWQQMARTSYQTYQGFLGLPGTPIEYVDSYFVSDTADFTRRESPADPRPPFADLQRELISDLIPTSADFPPGTHSLGRHHLRRNTELMFNITAYSRVLLDDFHGNGGRIEIREFHGIQDLASLPQKTLINATGYGAKELFGDSSINPVRGQLTRLIPQADLNYGLFYKGVSLVPRRDGLVIRRSSGRRKRLLRIRRCHHRCRSKRIGALGEYHRKPVHSCLIGGAGMIMIAAAAIMKIRAFSMVLLAFLMT